jgi:hypothetical protein
MNLMLPEPSPRTAATRRAAICALGAVAIGWSGAAEATQLKPHNLTQLIARSDLIVSGMVTDVTDGFDKGMPYTEVTLTVASSAKRKLATRSTFKFRQFGLMKPRKLPNGKLFLGVAPEGFARWNKDEQVVAFLFKPASKTGLRSTVGLNQGKFTLAGGRMANAQFNRNLFQGVQVQPSLLSADESSMLQRRGGDVDAQVLMNLVNRAVAGRWIEKGLMR